MENAIDIRDITVKYRKHKSVSIKNLFRRDVVSSSEYIYAVKAVSFSVPEGHIWGIVGKNGSGKSTLLRALAGVFSTDEGIIDLHLNRVSLLSLGVGFKSELPGCTE